MTARIVRERLRGGRTLRRAAGDSASRSLARPAHLGGRLLCAIVGGLVVLASGRDASAQVAADFNSDGLADLAVGAPGADGGRGTVSVFFGGRGTFTTRPGITIKGVYTGETYGAALATGDFNGDGRPELVVGAPQWSGGRGRVEVVRFVRNSRGALVPSALSFTESTARGIAEAGDRFGSALAAGDFDGDGFGDLAIGIPGDSHLSIPKHGGARVLYGSRYGITTARVQYLRQGQIDNKTLAGIPRAHDQFGFSLAAGDFNGDRLDDLAVGVPYEEDALSTLDRNSGAVHMFYGWKTGLSLYSQHIMTAPAEVARGATWYGYSLAAGDFDGNNIEDLAIGAPARTYMQRSDPAFLVLRYGIAGGFRNSLSPTRIQTHDVTPYTALFGAAFAAGDFNNDGYDDLAVGTPRQDVGRVLSAGAVHVFYGNWSGFQRAQALHQDSFNIREVSETGDRFGWSLAALDFNGDGWKDLAVGIPGEDVSFNSVIDGGAVALIGGSGIGLTETGNALLAPAVRHAYARFGEALSR